GLRGCLARLLRFGGERGPARTNPALGVLPELLLGVQAAQRTRHGLEVVVGKPVRELGVIERRFIYESEYLSSELCGRLRSGGLCRVRLARKIVGDAGAVRIGIRDALVALAR